MRAGFLVMALVTVLAGCGGGGSDAASGSTSTAGTDASATTADANAGLRDRLNACGMAINVQNAEIGNLSACLVGAYAGAVQFSTTPCSAELTADGTVRFTVDGAVRSFKRPFVYEGYTKKTRPVGQAGSGYSTTGYSIDWRADGAQSQSLVLDFNNDLRDGLQLRYTDGTGTQTCFLTVS